ncbi:hypothetical protein JB92DRAFT_2829302 [Gautieria morchelliformis]|nr:hypothetical protein JB92DRAFT_2829302 [Gautieria morchelliformis]
MLVSVTYQTGVDSKRKLDLLPVSISQDVMDSPTKRPSTPTTCNAGGPGNSIDADSLRNKLTDLGYYLGFPDLPAKVEWSANGRSGDQLVNKDSSMNTPEEAVLSVVGQIALDDFWLLPLGGWTPGNMFNEPITKARARCRLIRPKNEGDLQLFHNDWPTTLKNLELLQSKVGVAR